MTKKDNLKIFLYSLGCAKNQVEGEMMSGLLQNAGFCICSEPEQADVIIVNTCGFLTESKKEAIAAILRFAEYKQSGKCRLLLAVGCMPEKYADEMAEALPEIDAMLGSHEYDRIVALVEEKLALPATPDCSCDPYLLRSLSTPPYLAYLKIADGCDNGCAYCLIPQLRGPLCSRPMEDIVAEAKMLRERGVREIVLIAQDTSAYGIDIYGEPMLPKLLAKVAELDFHWVRIMYCYPSHITAELLRVMSKYDNICNYIDLPMQHSDSEILQAMGRSDTAEFLEEKIREIRSYMPDCALRTTVMVGFPGERVSHWHNLLDFLEKNELMWVGVFAFSREPDTRAYYMPHQVKESTKQRRRDITSEHIARITERALQGLVGTVQEVLVEGVDEYGLYYGRCAYQAYEVDGQVLFTSANELEAGSFVKVSIIGVNEYDLVGEEYELSE